MKLHRYLWALAVALLASCGEYGAPDEVLYGEAVFTQPKPGFDFAPLGTYYLAPNYVHFVSDVPVTDPLPSNVRTAIERNMATLGYTPLNDVVGADVALAVAVVDGTAAVYYPGYWCDYYYYYSCYYDYTYAGSYKYGAAILEMTQSGNVSSEDRAPVIWAAVVYGVATTAAYDTQRVADGFDLAFSKSPYLATTP